MTESGEFEVIPAVSIEDGIIVITKEGEYEPLLIDGEQPDTADFVEEVCDTYGRCLVVDLNGIALNKPQLKLLKTLGLRGDIWVDCGVRYGDSVIDVFIAGASAVLMGTKAIHDFSEFENALEMSEAVIFSIDYKEHVLSMNKGMERKSPRDLAAKIKEVGGDTVSFIDLGMVGSSDRIKDRIVHDLVGLDLNVYVGGGIKEKDLPRLKKMGVAGAFLEIKQIV